MMRRLGQQNYRAESPSQCSNFSDSSISLTIASDVSLPAMEYANEKESDNISQLTLTIDENPVEDDEVTIRDGVTVLQCKEERLIEKNEIAQIEANICRKLNTIVNLVRDFTGDAIGLRENPDDLLDELRNRVRPYLINLDIDMSSVEALLRYNIDRSNITEDRIDWLLRYTKYQKEMRRVLTELAGGVYDDLEDSLELRQRGVIARRPSTTTVENMEEMQCGMARAMQFLNPACVDHLLEF